MSFAAAVIVTHVLKSRYKNRQNHGGVLKV